MTTIALIVAAVLAAILAWSRRSRAAAVERQRTLAREIERHAVEQAAAKEVAKIERADAALEDAKKKGTLAWVNERFGRGAK